MTILLFMILPIPASHAATIGSLYHIKFNWKAEQRASAYYEMTTYIFDSMSKEPAYLYSEYGNFSGVYIWVPENSSYAKLERIISNANSQYIVPVIDDNSTLKTRLDKIFLDIDSGQTTFTCHVVMPMEFDSVDEVMKYLTKIQYYIFRRGYLISMTFIGKTEKKFDISFNFLADCISRKAIVSDLLHIVSLDHKDQRKLYSPHQK
ncbi:MAG: hypothetical protein L3J58_07825 [Emcibacter sp.]|nr:hypothetical protein [Emcibacter sp.]